MLQQQSLLRQLHLQLHLRSLSLQQLFKHLLQLLPKLLHLLPSQHQLHLLMMSLKNLKGLQLAL
jgi:hypothetical protein